MRSRSFAIQRVLGDTQGMGMTMVIPLLAALTVLISTLWSTVNYLARYGHSLSSASTVDEISTNVVIRIRKLIAQPSTNALCPDFSSFRNLAGAAVAYNEAYDVSTTNPIPAIDCVLTADEGKQLDNFRIDVERESVDLPSLQGIINLRLEITTNDQKAQWGLRHKVIERTLIMRALNVSDFGVIFTNPPGAPLITAAADSSVRFISKVFIAPENAEAATNTTLYNLTDFVPEPGGGAAIPVTYEETVYIRPQKVVMNFSANSYSMYSAEQVLKGGVQMGYMYGTSDGVPSVVNGVEVMPWDHPGPGGPEDLWNNFAIDYSSVYKTVTSEQGYPLARMHTGNVMAQDAAGTSPYVQANAEYNNIPNIPAGLNNVGSTCDTSDLVTGLIKSTVYIRRASDLTIDFTGILEPSPYQFCGMVAANKLTIITRAGSVHTLRGIFVLGELEIQGTGSVDFINPMDSSDSKSIELQQDFRLNAASIARPFFLPFFRDYLYGDGPPSYNAVTSNYFIHPLDASPYTAVCGTNRCWEATITPPAVEQVITDNFSEALVWSVSTGL